MNNDTVYPCKFCNQEVVYKPLEEMENYGVRIYFCYDCNVEYLYWMNSNIEDHISVSIYATHNNKMYRWTETGAAAHLWYVKTPGIPGTRKNENLELIKTFNQDIPTITPDNFIDKLSVYLLFL